LRGSGSKNLTHVERRATRHTVRMAYIQQVCDADATGDAKRELDLAAKRAGRVWNIVRIMTPNPAVLRASMQLYKAIMYGESPLSRAQREMLAVVVSKRNNCVY
ncbi:MAG: putative peroxidase-related enzyme, partial [Planctomycetota bacterium]